MPPGIVASVNHFVHQPGEALVEMLPDEQEAETLRTTKRCSSATRAAYIA